jgi:hypothetical protein
MPWKQAALVILLRLLYKSFQIKYSKRGWMAVCLYILLCSRILVNRFGYSLLRIQPQRTFDPVTGRLTIEQALLNVGNNESLENVEDAVDALLLANPTFLN